jgi:archaeosortase A (PGF-CTERM-specific)
MSLPAGSWTEVSVLPVTDVLAWVVVGVFLAGVLADYLDRREVARRLTVGAWGLFSVFWLLLIHHFALVHRSIVETVLVVVAVPMCLYVGWTLLRGRDSLLVLSRAVACMGLIYLPFQTATPVRAFLIEEVARETAWLLEAVGLGDGMRLIEDPDPGSSLVNTFYFPASNRASSIVFACTGIGSMAIFGGLIAAVRAPLRRKATALAVSLSIIWVLNVARNAFIAAANGYQWFDQPALEGPVMTLFGLSDPARVSFFVADRIISQGLALFALVGIGWLVSRWLPELLDIAEDLLFLLTGDEVRLRPPPTATDGGDTEA